MKVFSVPLVLSVLLLGSSWAAGQSSQGNPVEGKVVYEKQCLACHGDKLDGNGEAAQTLLIRPTNFLSVNSRSKTDWELLITIANGALFTPTHAYRGKLTDQQMINVLSYIRAVAPTDSLS